MRTLVLALAVGLGSSLAAQNAPEVHVIATGGTIASGTGGLRSGRDLVAAVPGLDSIARLTVEQYSNKPSESITPDDWRALALRVNELFRTRPTLAGVVVTHGTDTMEETAFFLDLTVGGCRPVIVTGAMRRASDAGADGPANLRNAVRIAGAAHARARGTMLLMHDEIFAARGVAKTSTSRLDAFDAPGTGPLGVADPDSVVFFRPAPACTDAPRFDLARLPALPRVDVVHGHGGADSVLVQAAVAAGARGLVVATVGRGGTPPSQRAALVRAAQAGVAVVLSSRTGEGRVPLSASWDATLPVAGAAELSPQQARVLLMLVLAAGGDLRREFPR